MWLSREDGGVTTVTLSHERVSPGNVCVLVPSPKPTLSLHLTRPRFLPRPLPDALSSKSMFERIRNYVYDRRRGLLTTAGVVGAGYVVGQYVVARLEEVRDRFMRDRGDKDK